MRETRNKNVFFVYFVYLKAYILAAVAEEYKDSSGHTTIKERKESEHGEIQLITS